MPIGKDSIQNRVAKATEAAPVEEVKAEVTEAPKKPAAPRKRTTGTTSKATTAKKTAAKKPAVKEDAPVSPVEAPAAEPATAVLANVSPETVAAVIGHDEKKPSDKVQIGHKMPNYLL